ncbi:FtsJ-like methyltransferase family protein [Aspergillus campestris IBT 28561]|uniref:FtsJ-like methyltransferase family protein n=1 Tax=Aspergillus campestris (strain IBT 28561) TaxID=1392248 RepID=A0A2I1DC68_ASPC2|nr:FtsJ-like methyltransferase family protein [Aspergillus campestris IBT 28561]PKY07467.1 FtsJ-like methyltransferase family protein [Aspergillus campestris IBT 28561]
MGVDNTSELMLHGALDGDETSLRDCRAQRPTKVISEYLFHEAPEFRRLSELRQIGWNNPRGDQFFAQQRRAADHADDKTSKIFYRMMENIGYDMHQLTGVFQIERPDPRKHSILDMCMAPGGFLATALHINPRARALGFSLPKFNGGHSVLLPRYSNVTLKFHDITMLAADMGLTDIPHDHPDAGNFLPSQFKSKQRFDLALCDGQVLRNHERAAYREHREASRLTLTQLALGLEHIKPGGTMIVLLHKVEAPNTVQLLHTFEKFASVRLYKPAKSHAKRSSFYMLATNIRADCEEAAMAISRWKKVWKMATLGTNDMYHKTLLEDAVDAEVLLKEFGPRLVELGKEIWDIQANALAKAPFVRKVLQAQGGLSIH